LHYNCISFLDSINPEPQAEKGQTKMNIYQISFRLILLTFLLIDLKETDAHFYGMVEKPTKFDSKQDFVDYMLRLNQHNAITSKLGTTRYGKRSFNKEKVSSDESYSIENDASVEQNTDVNDAIKKKMIIDEIVKLLKMLE
jgi:hypothetical protein